VAYISRASFTLTGIKLVLRRAAERLHSWSSVVSVLETQKTLSFIAS
jgi:hypothetical protein